MEIETQNIKDWYSDYKEKKLEKDIKRCKTFAVVSGAVASLSALVVAGNVVLGNGLEALQVGGTTAAMFGYLIGYSQMEGIYKREQKSFSDRQAKKPSFVKDRLETLKYQLEVYKSSLGMEYLVAGSFYISSFAHIIELLSMPSATEMVTSITGAALAALVGTLYIALIKSHRNSIKIAETEKANLEEIYELEEMSKKPIPELIENDSKLELEAPKEETEVPKILRLEEISKKK